MAAFTNLYKETGISCKPFRLNRVDAVFEANGNFFE